MVHRAARCGCTSVWVLLVDSSPNVNPMSIIDMRSIDPPMGNNRAVSSGTTRAIDAAGADYGVSFGHRGHHRADREDSGDRGHDCSLHIKSPSKIALFELQLAHASGTMPALLKTHDKRLCSVLLNGLQQHHRSYDRYNGNVPAAIIGVGGFLGVAQKDVVIPSRRSLAAH
jgi:hypothetical protein